MQNGQNLRIKKPREGLKDLKPTKTAVGEGVVRVSGTVLVYRYLGWMAHDPKKLNSKR
jgi:hypothetical protein